MSIMLFYFFLFFLISFFLSYLHRMGFLTFIIFSLVILAQRPRRRLAAALRPPSRPASRLPRRRCRSCDPPRRRSRGRGSPHRRCYARVSLAVAARACAPPRRPTPSTRRGISGLAPQGRRLEQAKLVFWAPSSPNGSSQRDLRGSRREAVNMKKQLPEPLTEPYLTPP